MARKIGIDLGTTTTLLATSGSLRNGLVEPKLTDFNYGAHRNYYRELQVPHIRRLTLQRPDVRVVFADSDEV
jgi:hypothetical protein